MRGEVSPKRYARRHPEIFNPVEQARLAASLAAAMDDATTGTDPLVALDLGCGTGNLTRHLLDAGAQVVAADVNERNLASVQARFGVETLQLNGTDLSNVDDASFDLVAAYSVLHHIPDYLAALDECARVLRPGGVLYIDHESHENTWDPHGCVQHFRTELGVYWRWRRFLAPRKILRRAWRAVHPKSFFGIEGDIHVWAWDHIEWDEVIARLEASGCEIVRRDDYLHFNSSEPRVVWERWRERCADMTCLVARRCPPSAS